MAADDKFCFGQRIWFLRPTHDSDIHAGVVIEAMPLPDGDLRYVVDCPTFTGATAFAQQSELFATEAEARIAAKAHESLSLEAKRKTLLMAQTLIAQQLHQVDTARAARRSFTRGDPWLASATLETDDMHRTRQTCRQMGF